MADGQNGISLNDVERGRAAAPIAEAEAEGFTNLSYEEIKNLLEIQQEPLWNSALREWDRKELHIGSRVDRREKARADVVNQIFNIVGFFSVFQGVVLTAVTQLQDNQFATCGLTWSPCVLSVVAAAVSTVGLGLKFKVLRELESSIAEEKALLAEVAQRTTVLRRAGKEKFLFHKSARDTRPAIQNIKSYDITWICVVLALWVFTVLFVLSYFAILCDSFVIRGWKGGLHRP